MQPHIGEYNPYSSIRDFCNHRIIKLEELFLIVSLEIKVSLISNFIYIAG